MENKIPILISLMLFVMVLIGVTIIQPIATNYLWIQPLIPFIFITGFFIFIIAAILFCYSIINNLKK
jgi:hypothetical protein